MSNSAKRMLFLLITVLVLLAGLAAFYFYLVGGGAPTTGKKGPDAGSGIVPVMSIYEYQGTPIKKPVGVASDASGNIYVTMRDGAPVLVFSRDGRFVRQWGSRGYDLGQLLDPTGIAVDSRAGRVYVADRGRLRLVCYDLQGRVQWETPVLGAISPAVAPDGTVFVSTHGPVAVLDREGQFIRQFGTRGRVPGQFDFARQLVVGPDGSTLFVADTDNARVQAVRPTGDVTATVVWALGDPPQKQDDPSTRFGVPGGIAQDSRGRLYVLDGFRYTIDVLDPRTGKTAYTWKGLEGDANGLFRFPTNIAYMGGDRFAVADTYNDRVQIVRLLPPGQNNIVARDPWLLWLLVLLLIPLALLLRRPRAHLTSSALRAVLDAGEFRLLAGAFKTLYVAPAVMEEFANQTENGVRVGDYLAAIRAPGHVGSESGASVESGAGMTEEQLLVRSARRSVLQRLLLVHNRIVCADNEHAESVTALGGEAVTLAQVRDEYELA